MFLNGIIRGHETELHAKTVSDDQWDEATQGLITF